MERQQTFRIWIISLLIFSSFMTACSFVKSDRKHFNQGVANYNSGDYEQAMADYNKAVELDPDYALAYYNRGCLMSILVTWSKPSRTLNGISNLLPMC